MSARSAARRSPDPGYFKGTLELTLVRENLVRDLTDGPKEALGGLSELH